ncbi:hypothetical protein [Streptomyces hydrogenans]|uniref:hypothetical protein n=1 Tax=Streptomyces hydrogenans TaxID=1873719 RepID=UPI0035DA8FF3
MGYDIYILDREAKLISGPDNYFRIGAFQMPTYLEAMGIFGMITQTPCPTPKPADFQLTPEDFRHTAENAPEVTQRLDAYRAACAAALEMADPEPTGIPAYKLQYNDGFRITVAEITAALDRYRAHPDADAAELPRRDSWWQEWTAFLRRATTYGGLRVH